LSLTVFSNCVSGSSNLNAAFLPDCTGFFRLLYKKFKECLKQSFSYSKCVLPAILSLTVFSNCVSGNSNFDTAFLLDCTGFLRLLDRKFNEDFKNMLKTLIFSLQVCFRGDFVPDCHFKLSFWQLKL